MVVIASLVFPILPWFSQYFLHVLNRALSLLGSLYLCTIALFKGGSPPPSFENFSFFLPPEIQKSGFLRQLRKKKNNETHLYGTKIVNIPSYLVRE